MKKTKLLKSVIIFSILFPTFAFYGCATKQDTSEIENTEITAPEEDETQTDEIEETTEYTETIELDETENDIDDTIEEESESDSDELPEIEEPEIFDAELPEEIEEEPPVEIEEEKITVEEVEPIVEIPSDLENETSNTQTPNQDTKPQIGVIVNDDDEVWDVTEVATTDDSVIDITDEDESLEEEVTEVEIIPSRSVTLRVGEYLEIDYPGKGWIFMGATDGSKNLTSAGRKLGDKDTNFTLLARNEGTSILHFFKEDVLAGVYIDDYIEVTVEPTKSSSKTRVKAPSYAETVPKKPEKKSTNTQSKPEQSTTTKETETKTETPKETQKQSEPKDITPKAEQQKIEQTPTAPKIETPAQETKQVNETPLPDADELLKSAKSKIDAKNYDSAKNDLELFLNVAESDRDEALYLLGQIYESNSKSKDIKKAIESYEKLMSNYPTSKFWDDANKRAIYLKRFYINVR